MLTPETLWVAPWFFHYSDDNCWIQNKTSELQVDDECGAKLCGLKYCVLCPPNPSQKPLHIGSRVGKGRKLILSNPQDNSCIEGALQEGMSSWWSSDHRSVPATMTMERTLFVCPSPQLFSAKGHCQCVRFCFYPTVCLLTRVCF